MDSLKEIALLAFAVVLTVAVELPIIRIGKVTKHNGIIIAINVVTNLTFNVIYLLLYHVSFLYRDSFISREGVTLGWYVFAELLLIPLSEAFVYGKISKASGKRILVVTYLANFASCLAGELFQRVFDLII